MYRGRRRQPRSRYVMINDRLLYSIPLPRSRGLTTLQCTWVPTADCGAGGARNTVHAGVADAQKTLEPFQTPTAAFTGHPVDRAGHLT